MKRSLFTVRNLGYGAMLIGVLLTAVATWNTFGAHAEVSGGLGVFYAGLTLLYASIFIWLIMRAGLSHTRLNLIASIIWGLISISLAATFIPSLDNNQTAPYWLILRIAFVFFGGMYTVTRT